MTDAAFSYREGTASDLEATFAISEHAVFDQAARQGVLPAGVELSPAELRRRWRRLRPLIEFLAGQPRGRYLICESADGPVGYARVVRFGEMEQLTELMVSPEHQGRGIGRSLLQRCWPGDPTPTVGRLVIATGAPRDLSLYPAFGAMPVAGHWHMRQRTEPYREARAQETDSREPAVSVLEPERARAEWRRLEPAAIGHERFELHEFLVRDRSCLASVDERTGVAAGLCLVSPDGEIGPAVAGKPEDLAPVVLAALDRVALTQDPEQLSVFCTTVGWRLLRRLRGLGFRVYWPSWVMSSLWLPGLDRYVPTRPPHVL